MNEEIVHGRAITEREVVEGTIALVEKGWTKGHAALDAYGNPISPHHLRARMYCLSGACSAATGDPECRDEATELAGVLARNAILEAIRKLHPRLKVNSMHEYNDRPFRTKAQVLAVLNEALKLV